jgi:hypothetical protein
MYDLHLLENKISPPPPYVPYPALHARQSEIDDLPALAVDGFSLGQDTQAFRPVELA